MPALTPTPEPDAIDVAVDRFRTVYTSMRAESRAAVDTWLDSAYRRLGGTLIVQAPSASARRDLPEAALASERFTSIAAPLVPGASTGP